MLPALSGMLPDSLFPLDTKRALATPANVYGAAGKMPAAAGNMPALPH